MTRRRATTLVWAVGGVITGAVLVTVGTDVLRDVRVRLHTLVTVDPSPSPLELHVGGARLTVTGVLVKEARADRLVLRAWAPTPTIHVVELESGVPLMVRVENLPTHVRLVGSGPIEEARDGLTRTLRFAPGAIRHLEFRSLDRDVTFAVLGDTGDHPTFGEALRLAAVKGADFLIHAGDLIYEDAQIPAIAEILATAPVPVYVVRGNHDYRNAKRIAFMRELAPPYYAFGMGDATWLVLDNAGDYLPWAWRHSTQYRWWTHVLGEARDGPLFVAMHKPPFDRRTPSRGAGMYDTAFARQLVSDIARAGVNAVFTGHVHASHLWVEEGIPYVVNGEGFTSPEGPHSNHMAFVRVRGGTVSIEQVLVWKRAAAERRGFGH